MTKYLITASLLNSYVYYIQDEWKSPADSRADFLKTLSRERFKPNEAMQKGINFEDSIGGKIKGIQATEGPIYEIGQIIKGGIWQMSCKKDLQVGNQEFLLYGRTDVIKRDTIYDVKFTKNYEVGKFLNSAQHLIYLYCLNLPKFQYLVSDGENFWIEDYYNHAGVEGDIKSKITDFMDYLESDQEAKEMFLTKWESQYDK